jgi:hypothetical protein
MEASAISREASKGMNVLFSVRMRNKKDTLEKQHQTSEINQDAQQ